MLKAFVMQTENHYFSNLKIFIHCIFSIQHNTSIKFDGKKIEIIMISKTSKVQGVHADKSF